MSKEKVSLRNLKEYIKASKTVEPQEETLSIPNDDDLLAMIKRRLETEKSLDISEFESKLRLLLIQKMEERDKNKRLQQLNLLTPTKTTN